MLMPFERKLTLELISVLPDLHVADSSFSSFDFLDGSGVDAFGGVLREADEAHSRDQGRCAYTCLVFVSYLFSSNL